MFLFGGALAGLSAVYHVIPFAVMTFFAMLAREIIKDAEDVDGDKASGAITFPIRNGIRPAVLLASGCGVFSAIASLVPYLWWGTWYVLGILFVDALILSACALAIRCTTPEEVRLSRASSVLKAGMFLSLVVFTGSALVL